ncbi:TPA: hypothetical protein SAY52_000978 [Burkholderia cenocepacia]|uniref:hypothetical protein n=1 Tax=unclassified Burkholderia TaxID=2613784 RepID=UPI001589E064|nr:MULTISPECIES: hypothetical protein [unclassified Burkholderia]HEF5870411.1 hypothetical protein [Burkholderia cenocepacia]
MIAASGLLAGPSSRDPLAMIVGCALRPAGNVSREIVSPAPVIASTNLGEALVLGLVADG